MAKRRHRAFHTPQPRLVRYLSGLWDQLGAYGALQWEIFKDSLRRLRQTPVASTLTVLVIAIALTLPASLHVLVDNAREASAGLESTSRISLFLKPDLSNEVGRKLAERLKKHPRVAETTLITKEAGLKELQTYSGFGEALRALNANPLPVVISIKAQDSLADPAAMEALLAELGKLPEADFAQFDTEWLQKLRAMLDVAERGIRVFGLLLAFGVLFTVGNTIRLELQQRREDIAVTKLLGATDGFIRRPFLYAGFWYGFLGGVLAWLLSGLLILLLHAPATRLAELYGSPFRLTYLGFVDTGWLLGVSVLLGVAGAFAVATYHLRRLDP
ncbi:permease-like cell division protein FtsX [Methylomagnum sp.]